MTVTLFSWGYWGWGNATERLVEAIDAAEQARGYRPPIFIDTRLRRQGRAKGFVGNAFRDLVGEARYRWMQDLGNLEIATGGKGVQLKDPGAVKQLLDLALRAADDRQRVIFYCACEFLSCDGQLKCHRLEIADRLLEHAKNLDRAISVVEWPGEEPAEIRLAVDRKLLSAVTHGRMSIPFSETRVAEFAGLPWGSLVALECADNQMSGYAAVGPAKFATSKGREAYWYLPVIEPPGPGLSKETLKRHAERWRISHGLDERQSE